MQNLSELYATLFAVGGSDAAGGGGTGGTSPPSHIGGPIGSAFLRFILQILTTSKTPCLARYERARLH